MRCAFGERLRESDISELRICLFLFCPFELKKKNENVQCGSAKKAKGKVLQTVTKRWDKASRSEEGVHRSLVAKILGQLSVVVICF